MLTIITAVREAPDWAAYLLNGGPFAVVVLLILIGKLVPGPTHDRVLQENTELKEKLERMENLVETQVIPAMVRYADGLSRKAAD